MIKLRYFGGGILVLCALIGGAHYLQNPDVNKATNLQRQGPTVPHAPVIRKVSESSSPRNPASAASEAAPQGSQSDLALNDFRDLKNCYESQSCDFPQTDPRSYEFAVGKSLAARLDQILVKFRNDPAAHQNLQVMARESFKIEDGFVQSAALNILRSFPPSAENLEVLAAGIVNNPDPSIVEQVMNEFERYVGTPHEAGVHASLRDILQGPHFSAQAAAQNILNFVNKTSYDEYKRTLAKLNPQSQAAKDLKAILTEYERSISGG